MHKSENWDDLRYVLCVAREGSVSAAARKLSVNHATVLRRVASVEDRFGINLFDKSLNGYRMSDTAERIFEAITEIETAVIALERAVQGQKAPLRGVVRVTATDTMCHSVLPAIIRNLHASSSELRIELINTNHHMDLARMDAELSIRIGQTLSEDMQGDIVAALAFATYSAPSYEGTDWIGLAGPLARSVAAKWMTDTLAASQIVSAADSFLTVREMVAQGLGRAVLPSFLGESDPRLVPIDAGFNELEVPVWVACHRDMAAVPRIRAARGFLVEALKEQAGQLRGTAPRS